MYARPVSPSRSHRGDARRVIDLGQRDWYDEPAWYDILHSAGTAGEADALERIALDNAALPRGGPVRWLEPACGSGRLLRVIAGRGGIALGFDRSERMVRYATGRAERAGLAERHTVWVADMTRFELPTPVLRRRGAHVAFNLINSLRHLRTDSAVCAHLDAVRGALAPGGVYAVGLGPVPPGGEMPSEDVWTGARGSCRVTQIAQYLPPGARGGSRVERVVNHLVVETPSRETHLDCVYDLRTYALSEWLGLVARAGWRVVGVADESGRPLGPAEAEREIGYRVWVLAPD